MRISKVIIKNFRNFKEFETELGDNVILLGENGVGKTNFFDALRLVLDSSYHPQLGESDFHDSLPKFRGTEIEIQIQFSDFMDDKDSDFLNCIGGCFLQDAPPIAQVSFLYCPKDDVSNPKDAIGSDYYQTILYGGPKSDKDLDSVRRFRQYVKLRLIPALRDIEDDMRVWHKSPMRKLTDALNITENPDFLNVVQKVKEATNDLQAVDAISQLQKEVKDRISRMVECGYFFEPKIGLLPTSPDALQKNLTWLIDNDLSLDRMSLGLSNVLYLTLLMIEIELARQSKLIKGEYQYTILAIEEPEAHLHPQLQRLVFRDFLRGDMPLFLSTHSPNIVSVSEPDWFLLLKKGKDGTTASSTANLRKLPGFLKKDIQRYLDANRGEVVFAKGIILVEGDAESFLIPEFANQMAKVGLTPCSLDGAGVSVCNVLGTDFEPYTYFFGPSGLDIPVVILSDGDKYVRLDIQVKNAIQNKQIEKDKRIHLKKVFESGDLDTVRSLLDHISHGWYEGLNRGVKLIKHIYPEKSEELWSIYQEQKWDELRDELQKLGVFINDWTLEDEMYKSGYQEEFVEVYSELGASKAKCKNMQKEFTQGDVHKLIKRIEETGFGKGRFAQRLADKLDGNRIPPYIQAAIEKIILQICPSEEEIETSNSVED